MAAPPHTIYKQCKNEFKELSVKTIVWIGFLKHAAKNGLLPVLLASSDSLTQTYFLICVVLDSFDFEILNRTRFSSLPNATT